MVHLQKFIDRVRGGNARGGKDFTMPLNEAQGVAADLTELLLELRAYQQRAIASRQDDVVEITVSGGSFKQ
jgi:hypothetical protein